jgi:excisionase family DNA binding protein
VSNAGRHTGRALLDLDALRELIRDVVREELTALGASHSGYLSVTDAAALASVTPDTVRSWIAAGRLRRYSAGRCLRVLRSELETYLARPAGSDRDLDDLSPEELADVDSHAASP